MQKYKFNFEFRLTRCPMFTHWRPLFTLLVRSYSIPKNALYYRILNFPGQNFSQILIPTGQNHRDQSGRLPCSFSACCCQLNGWKEERLRLLVRQRRRRYSRRRLRERKGLVQAALCPVPCGGFVGREAGTHSKRTDWTYFGLGAGIRLQLGQ